MRRDATGDRGASVETYHGNHGRLETNAPVMSFVAYSIANQPHIVAGYTCTPLVKFPVDSLKPGEKVLGTTMAELGAGNQPIDMVIYKKDGQDYLLMANTTHGVMKIPTSQFATAQPITARVGGTAGTFHSPDAKRPRKSKQRGKALAKQNERDALFSEHAVYAAQSRWEHHDMIPDTNIPPADIDRICNAFDDFAKEWAKLPVGGSISLEWTPRKNQNRTKQRR